MSQKNTMRNPNVEDMGSDTYEEFQNELATEYYTKMGTCSIRTIINLTIIVLNSVKFIK